MRFTKSHEWVHVKDGVGTVGITHHAQKELGDIVFIQLPKVGQKVKAGKELCILESTKAAADVYTPVSGTVIAVNEHIAHDPTLINRLPESSGWLCRIQLSHPGEVEHLLTKEAYQKLIASSNPDADCKT
jgi:glycine cleavage system H protein